MGEEIWVRGFGWGFCRQGKEGGGRQKNSGRGASKHKPAGSEGKLGEGNSHTKKT